MILADSDAVWFIDVNHHFYRQVYPFNFESIKSYAVGYNNSIETVFQWK